MNKLMLILSIFAVACGRCPEAIKYIPGPTVKVPVTPPVVPPTEIEEIVAEKNIFRLAAGQLPLTRGLTCTLHVTSDPDLTHALPSATNTFTLMGNFNQQAAPVTNGLNTIPVALRPQYINGFAQRCQGNIVIVESGYYSFELTSDDAGMVYVDGVLVVNNNFAHGPTKIQGSRLLERGVHSFKLDFSQSGGGTQALILESSGVLVPSEVFYR